MIFAIILAIVLGAMAMSRSLYWSRVILRLWAALSFGWVLVCLTFSPPNNALWIAITPPLVALAGMKTLAWAFSPVYRVR